MHTRRTAVSHLLATGRAALCSSRAAASSSSPSSIRAVHPAYRRHVGQLLQYFAPSAGFASQECPLATLSDRSRVRQLTPEMEALVTDAVTRRDTQASPTPSAGTVGSDVETSVPSASAALVRFVNVLVAYLNAESDLEDRLNSRFAVTRIQSRAWDVQYGQKIRPTPLQRQELLRVACEIVQHRRVSLVVATRLLRCRWPRSFALDTGLTQQRFLRESIWAWLSEALAATTATGETASGSPSGQDALTPRDARAILDNCAFALRVPPSPSVPQSASASRTTRAEAHSTAVPSALVGPLAILASKDIESVTDPEPLIALLWSVHTTRVPAPADFWRPVLARVLVLNHHLGAGEGLADRDAAVGGSQPPSPRTDKRAGHFFSGLTTRHLYRLLSLLKKEKWPVEVSTLHELADLALKNIVFNTEALHDVAEGQAAPGAGQSEPRLSKRDVRRRLRATADLSVEELLELLLISGELGIAFNVSAAKVADALLTPLVPYLDVQQLLTLLQVVRQTHCHSVPFIAAVAQSVLARGPDVPYALPLAKALLRTILRVPDLPAEMELSALYTYCVQLMASASTQVRPQELCTMAALLYDLSRQISAESSVAALIRDAVDRLCAQMARLVTLRLANDEQAAKLLECTIVLGMRQDTEHYPHTQLLLEARKRVSALRDTLSDDGAHQALVADAATQPAELVSFWEAQPEATLPALPKAAVRVYEELIYILERTVTVRATLTSADADRFTHVLDRTGLYGLLVGLDCLGQAHLGVAAADVPEHSPLHLARQRPASHQLPGVLETRVLRAVTRRLRLSKLTRESTDNDVLHVLGHVHCDAKKVAFLLHVLARSPSRLVSQQRGVWVYMEELAKRFGDRAQLEQIRSHKERALY